jgi:CheY-like chemotaxis protein
MQGQAISKAQGQQFAKLGFAPRRRAQAWWNDSADTEPTPDTQGITVAAEGDDTVEPVAATTGGQTGNETVLVVDDEPMVRDLIAQILRQSGYRVLEASGTAEAQQLTGTNQKISLLLTDFSMPETNGLELARWFQREYPEMKVLITTGSLWELANQLGEQEQVAILPKPFDNIQLRRMVRRILG